MSCIRHAAACVALCLAAAPAFAADEAEGPVTAEFGGRIHWDFASFDNDARGPRNPDDTEVRRLWLDLSGKFYGWGYKIEGDFAGLQDEFSGDSVEAKDVYLTRDFKAGKLTVGQFKQYFTLDDRISSNYGVFMERSMFASSVAPLYRLGAAWITARPDYTVGGSVYSLESIDAWKVKGHAVGARGTWTPLRDEDRTLHLGLSLAREYYDHPGRDGANGLRIAPRPAGHLSDNSRATLVNFNRGLDTDVDKYSLEFGLSQGPLYVQSELGGANFDDGSQRGQVRSAYGLVGWFLTGESMPYDSKTGRFARVKPLRESGAWQVALRYDTIRGKQHLDGSANFSDVSMEQASLGVNWHLRSNLRFMLDWIESRNRDRLAGVTLDRTRALTGRFQYDF
ncbi:porin [Lysobacter sp. BMK333-48F3]|uniref:OprO/OprP family phosphate-selective porin n=1 Tax=Lysobacter sp. BMK333-48F3 TaxID=2867962 RepID=UPI001C8C0021|nr:porin [Lysobacter sp. BMK333-48F3]MBX9401481.1 porin [Lysobacter sp. BMK333-48F3]